MIQGGDRPERLGGIDHDEVLRGAKRHPLDGIEEGLVDSQSHRSPGQVAGDHQVPDILHPQGAANVAPEQKPSVTNLNGKYI